MVSMEPVALPDHDCVVEIWGATLDSGARDSRRRGNGSGRGFGGGRRRRRRLRFRIGSLATRKDYTANRKNG